MLKVISLSVITKYRRSSIKKDIMNLLGINFEDEILFILDKNGIVNVRKFIGSVILGTGEKYISSSRINQYRSQTGVNASVTITGDVRKAVNADIGDDILWILDNEKNIIIRNNVILGKCSKNIFNKEIGALIIGLTSLPYQSKIITIPKEITNILGAREGDEISLSLDNYGNIIISKEIRKNLLQKAILPYRPYYYMYMTDPVTNILDTTDYILWFFDEEGNIIIKNDLLPDICIAK
jgi:antitoxin component of MazEF toxin-antitoxin module